METFKGQWFPLFVAIALLFNMFGGGASVGGPYTNFDDTQVEVLIQGGDVTSSSTPTNSTMLYSYIDTENVYSHTLTQADGTLTTFASSSVTDMQEAGDSRVFWIVNATTTAGTDLTLACGTGMTCKRAASTTLTLIGDTDGDNAFRVEMVRETLRGNIDVYVTKYED